MNKILMDGDKIILNEELSSIEVNGYARIYINNIDFDLDINIKLNESSKLEIYDFNINNHKRNYQINQTNNTTFNLYHTFKVDDKYNFTYRTNLNGDNNINNVNIYGISNGMVLLDVDGKVVNNTKGNTLNENIKVLTIMGSAEVLPMMHISTQDVIANHNTAISNIREDELFYLMSKGIDKNKSIELITDGYLYGYFKRVDEEFYNLIKN